MSSDFYFRFWSKTLDKLEKIVRLDVNYQTTKCHDEKRCEAAQRLIGVLAEYRSVTKDLIECERTNLQIQKIGYIGDLVEAVVSRITELNNQIRKLESSNTQFFGQGLKTHRITTNDIELNEVPNILERPEFVERMIEEAFEYAQIKHEEKEKLAKQQEEGETETQKEEEDKWWETDAADLENNVQEKFRNVYDVDEKVDEETLKRRELVTLIQAHEKTRQITQWCTQRKERRNLWTKELKGEKKPEAKHEIKDKSSQLIQKVLRAFFELKRKKLSDLKRDQLLGLNYFEPLKIEARTNNDKIAIMRSSMRKKYLEEWKTLLEDMKNKYLNKKAAEINEDFRDGIREWFLVWYNQVKKFYDIPNEKNGGSVSIVKEEVPSPLEWWEQYQAYLQNMKSKKNKSTMQQKWEQKQSRKNTKGDKDGEQLRKKMEEALQKKIMKNPKMHPGFQYPKSERTEQILKEIQKYRNLWNQYDKTNATDVKEKYVTSLINEDAWFEVNMEVRQQVDTDMRKELKILKKPLKRDYKSIGEKIPDMKIKRKKIKKKKIRAKPSEHVLEKMKELAVKGILQFAPRTNLTDFIGDPNFAGDDNRCMYKPAMAYAGETRNLWWEKCRDVIHGSQIVLLVGPEGCGKSTLIHAMSSANNACLFVLDPATVADEFLSSVYLENLLKCVLSCAKATQPAVIYIRHVQKLFYRKVPSEEKDKNLDMIKKYLIRYLLKRIHKTDNVTIVGTCVDPWLTKSKIMLKKFPNVLMLPNTNYSTVVQILKDWVLRNHTLPREMDIHTLARMLQGYKISFLKKALQDFMTAEMIIKIAAHGVTNQEVFNYILEFGKEHIIDYSKYQKWYSERTIWGQKEKKQLESQLEFRAMADKLEEKKKKRNRRSSRSSKRSSKGSRKSR